MGNQTLLGDIAQLYALQLRALLEGQPQVAKEISALIDVTLISHGYRRPTLVNQADPAAAD